VFFLSVCEQKSEERRRIFTHKNAHSEKKKQTLRSTRRQKKERDGCAEDLLERERETRDGREMKRTTTSTEEEEEKEKEKEEEDRASVLLERLVASAVSTSDDENDEDEEDDSSYSQLYPREREKYLGVEEEEEEEDSITSSSCWKRLDEEEEREAKDGVLRCAKRISSSAALDVFRLHFFVSAGGVGRRRRRRRRQTPNDKNRRAESDEERKEEETQRQRRRRTRRAELVLAKLLFNSGDYLCALVVLDLILDGEDEASSTTSVGVDDDEIEEETKALEVKCVEEISKRMLERKTRTHSNSQKVQKQGDTNQDSLDVTSTTRTTSNYDDIPAVLLRNGAYKTSRAIGLARLASTSTGQNNSSSDEKMSAANAYNVALACLGANNDLESALELLSRGDVLRTYRFDQNYWLRLCFCMLQWYEKTEKEKTKDESKHFLKRLSLFLRAAQSLKELRETGWNRFLTRAKKNNEAREEYDSASSSAILDEMCDRFKIVSLECTSSS